jgi:hypothetical protein
MLIIVSEVEKARQAHCSFARHRKRWLFITILSSGLVIPLSFKGEGEEIYREGFHPSLTYTPPSLAKGRGSGDGLLNNLLSCL